MSYEMMLIKILAHKYLEDFLDGNLYMNADAYFANVEDDCYLRSDTDEGADEALQFKEIAIQDAEGNWIPIGGAQSPLIYRYGEKESRNILCMYMLTDKPDFRFDERNIGFGDSAVIITDAKEFVNRFKAAAQSSGKRLLQGRVEYVNKREYHGKMGPFRKFSEYKHQSEFRFLLLGEKNESPEALKLPIGDIRDISVVCSSEQLLSLRTQRGD